MLLGGSTKICSIFLAYFPDKLIESTTTVMVFLNFAVKSARTALRGAPTLYGRFTSCFLGVSLRPREEYVSLSNDLRAPELFSDPTACFLLLAYCLPHLRIAYNTESSTHTLVILSPTYLAYHTSRDRR